MVSALSYLALALPFGLSAVVKLETSNLWVQCISQHKLFCHFQLQNVFSGEFQVRKRG